MNKFVILGAVLGSAVLLSACEEKKPLTPEEVWHGYCTSIGNAARSILLDRQNGIEKTAAVEHASKLTDPTTKKFVDAQIEKVYAYPANQLELDRDALMAKFKKEATDECLATPYDKDNLPDYKQF
ncbi:hypothetical protein [Acinetobacter sp. YH16032]|uniref:hypothetical protein n=1 Tax=Acinetobacter sp. YH16032 TaxID=2601181 RepID=UPI0015D13BCF|nr:hypothetical protein [Acinetobacter sp. YH16032]